MLDNDEREGADILALEYAMQEVKEGNWELALEIVGRNGRKVLDSEKGAEKAKAEPEARQDPGKNEAQRGEQKAPSLPIRTSEKKLWADMEDEGLDDICRPCLRLARPRQFRLPVSTRYLAWAERRRLLRLRH